MSLTATQSYVQSLLQGLVGAYNNSPLEAWVDPPVATGFESQLLVIGDKLRWRYLPQRNVGESGQEWLDYAAQLTFEVQVKEQYV